MDTTNGAVLITLLGASLVAIALLASWPTLAIVILAWASAGTVVLALGARVLAGRDRQISRRPGNGYEDCESCQASYAACHAGLRHCCLLCTHTDPNG